MEKLKVGDIVAARDDALMKLNDHRGELAEIVGIDEFAGQGMRVRVRWPDSDPEFTWLEAGLFEKAPIDEILGTLPRFVADALLDVADNEPIATVTTLEGPLPTGFAYGFEIDDGLQDQQFLVAVSSHRLSLCARVAGAIIPKGAFYANDRASLAKAAVNHFYKSGG